MLNVFIEQLKELYGPYVEKTVQLLCTIIQDHPNDDVKQEACKCLPNLISAIKTSNQPVAIQLARHFMSTLVTTIEREFDTDIMIVELETLKSVIEELDLCFLAQEEVKAFSEKMLNLLKLSDEKKLLQRPSLKMKMLMKKKNKLSEKKSNKKKKSKLPFHNSLVYCSKLTRA